MKSEKLKQVVQAYYDQAFGVGRFKIVDAFAGSEFVYIDYELEGKQQERRMGYFSLVPFMLERGTFDL